MQETKAEWQQTPGVRAWHVVRKHHEDALDYDKRIVESLFNGLDCAIVDISPQEHQYYLIGPYDSMQKWQRIYERHPNILLEERDPKEDSLQLGPRHFNIALITANKSEIRQIEKDLQVIFNTPK